MSKYFVSILFLVFLNTSFAQKIQVVLNGGFSTYMGDMATKIVDSKQSSPVFGIGINYELTEKLFARALLAFGQIEGKDAFNSKADIIQRNLSFKSEIQEFSITGEYHLLNLENHFITPYIFAGLGVFHFNPYTYDTSNQKVYLKPLSTEGQGLSQYPDKKNYSLTQFNIPFGAGVKLALTNNIRFGIEIGFRKLFTDYLDDVSNTYVDENILRNAKGQQAVDLAYRGYEISGGNPVYPSDGSQRGNPTQKDMYSFSVISVAIRLGSNSSIFERNSIRKLNLGCPSVTF